jgi:hypothetical protein
MHSPESLTKGTGQTALHGPHKCRGRFTNRSIRFETLDPRDYRFFTLSHIIRFTKVGSNAGL